MSDNPQTSDAPVAIEHRLQMVSDIVSAYVKNNVVAVTELPALIASVHESLEALTRRVPDEVKIVLDPALPIADSVTDDYIYCLEDGLPFKSLRRHLRSKYNMTPDSYRAKWGLPADYPIVAPNYAKQRSELAKKMGLGKGDRGV